MKYIKGFKGKTPNLDLLEFPLWRKRISPLGSNKTRLGTSSWHVVKQKASRKGNSESPKGRALGRATAPPRARAQLGLAKIPTRKREKTSQNLKIEDFFELAAKKNCHLEHLRDGRRTK